MAYIGLVIFVIVATLVGVGGLILMECMISRREQRWLDRVSR